MSKKRVLFITQEMKPYTVISEISDIVRALPQHVQQNGFEIRVLMPKYGTINERRHRLHEVVRLSGMNIIVDDEDYPLILKVASLPGARMQVYFLDNEEFFKRKFIFHDEDEKAFEDNPQRTVFFCKGVMETVKKFGWPPDIIHCHGWMTALIPFYIKTVYKNDPIFENAKLFYSVYNNGLGNTFNSNFLDIAAINTLEEKDLASFQNNGSINLQIGGMESCDVICEGSETLDETVSEYIKSTDKKVLKYMEGDGYLQSNIEMYKNILEEEEA